MPARRKAGSAAGRSGALHALAHIELNAIDLAWDIVARFGPIPAGFSDDWVQVADDEARHFDMLSRLLVISAAATAPCPPMTDCGSPARTPPTIWQPGWPSSLVLEARGLDGAGQ